MNRVWTEEELDILRRDRAAKVPVPVTAAKLGRPVPATYARARLIGTLVQPHQSWDEVGVARLRELVLADPPMTDKHIAAALGRTVTQIRWKMQDLGLIGVRDLSKLAKVTASQTARPKVANAHSAKPPRINPAPGKPASEQPSIKRALPQAETAAPVQATAPQYAMSSQAIDPQAALHRAIEGLEQAMAERLKEAIAASEAGMIQAARAAIAEKGRIDQRLVVRVKRSAEAAARREAEARTAEVEAKRQEAEAGRAEAEAKRAEAAREARERAMQVQNVRSVAPKPVAPKAAPSKSAPSKAAAKPAVKKPVLPAVQGVAQAAPLAPPPPAVPALPKIVVTDAPAAARPAEPDPTSAQTSGRGGWKSVRRDPARVLAQAKAKAKPANRADAVDLAQAAQAAIERFITERGVTRNETGGIQLIVSRLQARGYIVVRDENGWTIDQRHRIDSEADLVAFAEARGIVLSAAA